MGNEGKQDEKEAKGERSGEAPSYDINHPNTMIVINSQAELSYIIEWCEAKDILPPYLGERKDYPIAASANGEGWTNHMDRALYYMPFVEFIKAVS